MSGKTFVDTNVFVYAVDEAEPAKREIAQRVLTSGEYGEFVLSSQILGEFYVTVTRKLTTCVSEAEAAQALDRLGKYPTVSIDATLVKRAVQIGRTAQLSYWDGLVVAAAAHSGCERLLTEDLNDGQEIDSVRVENPFRDAA